ncbi:hypothetical protein J1614_010133 [Plenodomus biglobosus]|nr:hypothetical protein J1614_010133 [Plenodomus biglobosus]
MASKPAHPSPGNATTPPAHTAMMPRTRSGNRDADFKVYYSKRVPQQLHFPHKRKTVRRPSSPTPGDVGNRQMVFLPDKMKVRPGKAVRDSDAETEDEDRQVQSTVRNEQTGHGHALQDKAPKAPNGNKRSRDVGLDADSDKEKPMPSTSKRRRTAAIVSKTERTVRRQSTMTQLVDGRRPLSDVEEPDFQPVKRGPRLSWGGGGKGQSKSKDKQQQTLTQMIPGMRPLEIVSDEDSEHVLSDPEARDSDSEAYDMAVAQRLAVRGHVQDVDPHVGVKHESGVVQRSITGFEHNGAEVLNAIIPSVEDTMSDAGEQSYRPTQYIDAPCSRPTRMTRGSKNTKTAGKNSGVTMSPKRQSAPKSRFSLLNTPEKRRLREIPSSQSPADSPLSTQLSPQKSYRSPLHNISGNSVHAPETPSKRKRVTFKEPSAPTLKKFESTIQDSEDEDDGIEEDVPAPHTIGCRTELSPELGDPQTCAKADQTEPGEPAPGDVREPWNDYNDNRTTLPMSTPHLQPHHEDVDGCASTSIDASLPNFTECLYSVPPPDGTDHQDTIPSTPMVIQDDSSDEELDEGPTAPHQSDQHVFRADAAGALEPADLDGEPVQVPRSPSAQHETQQSHSSKAEQQLHSEWFSYSQYINPRPLTPSSMFVAHDPSSYGIPQSVQRNSVLPTHSPVHAPSQATTLDEVTQRTPRRNKTQQLTSANTTPRQIASSQPLISPSRPPPLFIPSSFPSPAKAAMQEWSSPVHARTQDLLRSSQLGMSLEEFSIPLPPPPVQDEWGYEE